MVVTSSASDVVLPVVDLAEELSLSMHGQMNGNLPSFKCDEVRRALEEHGCFIVEYGAVSAALETEQLVSLMEDLFDLPLETKRKNKYDPQPLGGYLGQNAKAPGYEGLGIVNGETVEGVKRFADHMWPDHGNPKFCQSVRSLSKPVADMGLLVIQMVFQSYGVSNYYESARQQLLQVVRLNKYRAPESDDIDGGLGPHSDRSFLTILYQFQTNGLEIQTKNNGGWISLDLAPSSFVVLAGQGLMAWSNGRIHPAWHKVNMTNKVHTRYSFSMFTNIDALVKTPDELVDEEHPLQFKPLNTVEYMRLCYADRMGDKSPVTLESIYGVNRNVSQTRG